LPLIADGRRRVASIFYDKSQLKSTSVLISGPRYRIRKLNAFILKAVRCKMKDTSASQICLQHTNSCYRNGGQTRKLQYDTIQVLFAIISRRVERYSASARVVIQTQYPRCHLTIRLQPLSRRPSAAD
ncbi:hypothetical protein BIW11_12065, partial [Tropilaelaps mercedesae]